MTRATRETVSQVLVGRAALTVRTRGTAGTPLVFVSGLGDRGDVWQGVFAQLDPATRTVTIDRPGIGDSEDLDPADARRPRTASWMAAQLISVMDEVGVAEPAIVVGHSLGALIADALAVGWPARIAGLVLVDAVDSGLQLEIVPPHPLINDGEASRRGRGWQWDVAGSVEEFQAKTPVVRPPTVVVASAVWRWFGAKEPSRYEPFTLAEVDQRWQRMQLEYAVRWSGELIVAHEAGHRVHVEAPALVACAIRAVSLAITSGQLDLSDVELRGAGGSRRPTS